MENDLLKRNEILTRFYDLISTQEGISSIAIDGRWGSGKTFFVKQSMMLINAKNPNSKMDKEKRNRIINAISLPKQAEVPQNYDVAIYYDAWENDNENDPVLSLVYEITKQLDINYHFENSINIFNLAGSVLDAISGKKISGIIENLKSEDPLKKIKEEKKLRENIKELFTKLLDKQGKRLVIFVDELDRCKPSYAVQLLERIKHYLCDERITFIISVNLDQLQHTIKHYYGETFDACRYLDRFFDMRLSIPIADKTEFYKEIGLDSTRALEKIYLKVIDTYNMELREVIRFYPQIKRAVYKFTQGSERENFNFADGKGREFLLTFITPILVGLKIVNISLCDDFVNGDNSKPLMDIYNESYLGKCLCKHLYEDEAYKETEGKRFVTIEQILQSVYEAIFATQYTNEIDHKMIGKCKFNVNSKNFVLKSASMLSRYAQYNEI